MAFELREGQGTLFRNTKRTSDNAPHARGEALIGGVLYEIAAWTREGRNGKFQSLAIKPKQDRLDSQDAGSGHASSEDQEIPF